MLTVPNLGEGAFLDAATGKTPASVWTLRLYTAISPPISNGTIAAHLTEATGGGYAPIPLSAVAWVTTPGAPTSSAYPKQTFTFTGVLTGNPTLLGYYLTRADGAVVAIEALPAPFTPASNGDALDVTPALTAASVMND